MRLVRVFFRYLPYKNKQQFYSTFMAVNLLFLRSKTAFCVNA